ncbi:XKR5 protein, partial [Amia calva]|nr:XKR5 protein [Amia calva]
MGVVHVFCFLNLKDGPSRFRMAGFYVVMLLENTTLVLSASDFLSAASWDSVGVLSAMLGSFLLGIFSLVVYYHFLHPKSTEISHSLWGGPGGSACWEKGELSFSLGDKMAAAPPLHVTGSLSLSGLAGSLLGPPGSYGSESQGESGHHHWLLLRLALKTGDRGKISQAYGAGAVEAILNVELYHPETDDMSSPASDWDHGIVPFTEEWREDPQGPDQKPSPEDEQQGEQEEERTELGSPLDSQELEFQRGSPEGKSVLGDSPELNVCPTESSSTLYFSADPQSPSSASNPGLDRDGGGDSVAELSPISSEPVALRGGRVWLGRAEPRFTSTPKQETSPQEQQGTHMAGARRQLLPWRREEAGHS